MLTWKKANTTATLKQQSLQALQLVFEQFAEHVRQANAQPEPQATGDETQIVCDVGLKLALIDHAVLGRRDANREQLLIVQLGFLLINYVRLVAVALTLQIVRAVVAAFLLAFLQHFARGVELGHVQIVRHLAGHLTRPRFG